MEETQNKETNAKSNTAPTESQPTRGLPVKPDYCMAQIRMTKEQRHMLKITKSFYDFKTLNETIMFVLDFFKKHHTPQQPHPEQAFNNVIMPALQKTAGNTEQNEGEQK